MGDAQIAALVNSSQRKNTDSERLSNRAIFIQNGWNPG